MHEFIGFQRSNGRVWTLKGTAAAGCELCQLIWTSLAYQCPSEKAERALETFNGELTILVSWIFGSQTLLLHEGESPLLCPRAGASFA